MRGLGPLEVELALRHLDVPSHLRRQAAFLLAVAVFALVLATLMDLTEGEEVAVLPNAVFAVAFAVFLTGLRAGVFLWARRLTRVAATAGDTTDSPLRRRAKTWPAAEPLGKVERAAAVRDLQRFAVGAVVVGVGLAVARVAIDPAPGAGESALEAGLVAGPVFSFVAVCEAQLLRRRGRPAPGV